MHQRIHVQFERASGVICIVCNRDDGVVGLGMAVPTARQLAADILQACHGAEPPTADSNGACIPADPYPYPEG